MRCLLWLMVAVFLSTSMLLIATGGASAHESRTVAEKYRFVVGFITEPALLEQPNGVDLRSTNTQTNQPVEGGQDVESRYHGGWADQDIRSARSLRATGCLYRGYRPHDYRHMAFSLSREYRGDPDRRAL